MKDFLQNLFVSSQYKPQGSSYLWQPELLGLHFLSDLLIGIGYCLISFILFYVTRKNKNLPFNDIFGLFALLMLGCGSIHLLSVWTLWYPAYWISGWLKAAVALTFMHAVLVTIEAVPKLVGKNSETLEKKLENKLENQLEKKKVNSSCN